MPAGKNVRTQDLIEQIVALRMLELDGGPDGLADVRDALAEMVGPTVSRATGARLLGVSQTALDRHIRLGRIAAVDTPGARLELPLAELVALAIDTRRLAAERFPLASALEERERRARAINPTRLLSDVTPTPLATHGHRQAELRSLAFHRVVAERLDEQLVRDAQRRLRRWQRTRHIDERTALLWQELLELPLDQLAERLSADDQQMRDLRQSSPFAGSLSEPERRRALQITPRAP